MKQSWKKNLRLYFPLLMLGILSVFLIRGLWLNPRELPSVFIDKPLPTFSLPVLPGVPAFNGVTVNDLVSNDAMAGQPWVLNVFASWCAACVVEHPHLVELAKAGKIRLVGLAYKDDPAATLRWLNQHGNPYDIVLKDQNGRAGIDFGVYGVPETFVLDAHGIVAYKHIGPIDGTFYQQVIVPTLASKESAS